MRVIALASAVLASTVLVGCSASTGESSNPPPTSSVAPTVPALPVEATRGDSDTDISAEVDPPTDSLPGELQTALSRDPATTALLQRPEFSVTRSGAFTLIDFAPEAGGEGVRVLLGPHQDQVQVLDAGSANVGCGVVTDRVLTDLGLRCF